MTNYKTKSEAIEAVKAGKLQISCRSNIMADEVCQYTGQALHDWRPTKRYLYFYKGDALAKSGLYFGYEDCRFPILTAKRFLNLPSEEVKPLTIAEQVAKCVSGV